MGFTKKSVKYETVSVQDQVKEILSAANASLDDERFLANVPLRFRLQYAKVLFLPPEKRSRALAVKMKCYECMGFESVASRIGGCTSVRCPLWHHRPYKTVGSVEGNAEEEEES